MRRSDREVVGLTNILSILDKCDIMRLGLSADNKPYIVPMNFAYEVIGEKVYIYFHCASKGRKMEMIAQSNTVCFEADCSYKTLKSDIACDWSAEFESVIGEGTVTVLTDETQKINALNIFMKRYAFEGKPHYNPHELSVVTILQVSVTTITGKRKIKKPANVASMILDGKSLAKEIEANLYDRAKTIIAKTGVTPVLATILVGNNPSSVTYVKMKGNACRRIGIEPLKIEMPENSSTDEITNQIRELNKDESVFGILLQHPVPRHIDEQKCFNAIDIAKDTDGVNTNSFGAMAMQLDAFKSATPLAIMSIIEHYKIDVAGKNAVVIGRSPILGKPIAMLLLNADATVTICHSKTQNLPEIVRRADIVVAAVGKARFVKSDWIKEGAVLIDAGYNEGNVGDIDLENALQKSSAYTPVPGGVGPVTISKLIEQTIEAAEKKFHL